jgi:hypothetical protein
LLPEEEVVAAAFGAVEGLIVAVPTFISPQLKRILSACVQQPNWAGIGKAATARTSLINSITKRVPSKALFQAVLQFWPELDRSDNSVRYARRFVSVLSIDSSNDAGVLRRFWPLLIC